MTTRKIIVIVVSIVLAVGLVVVVVAGGIVGFALYSLGNSEAAATAQKFLRENERLKQEIGEIRDFGSFVTGGISINNGVGSANLNMKVIGEKKEVNASVSLMHSRGGDWRVTEATYRNDAGQTIDLINAYEGKLIPQFSSR